MESKDTKPSVPWVPPEIWRHIIFNLNLPSLSYSDLAQTWTNLRGVSSFFQAEIEALFQELVLPGMKIDIWLKPDLESKVRQYASSDFHAVFDDRLEVPKPSKILQRRIRCTLNQVCKDDSLATFHPNLERPIKERCTVVIDQVFKMLVELCRPQVEGPFAQHYMLQVSGVYNNLVIPEMRMQKREWAISFDWKKLFSRLFSEEKVAMELAKLSEEATKEILQRERHHHCLPNDGDFRSHLRSKRFRNWYDHQCSYVADEVPESVYFDSKKVAQRLLESGLREYHLRFDREMNRLPVLPWNLRRYNSVLPGDNDGESSDGDFSGDYDSSTDGEDDDDDEMFLPMAQSSILWTAPDEEDDDDEISLPVAQSSISRSAPEEEEDDEISLPMAQSSLSWTAPDGEDDDDAASEPNTLEYSMPEDSSD